MVAPGIRLGSGITLGAGIGVYHSGAPAPTPGVNNITGYSEMPPPVTAGGDLEDTTATINSPTGFTINDNTKTGIAITALSASNQSFFATFGTGTKTVTWGAGSTVASSTINVTTNTGSTLVFFVQGQTGAATYNYPFTFSSPPPTGQEAFTTAGTFSWTAPAGVTSICVVAVGAGGGGLSNEIGQGGGAGGGGLGYKNNISVTPGQSYTVVVGAGGTTASYPSSMQAGNGGDSYLINTSTVAGLGGQGSYASSIAFAQGGSYAGDGGGQGGTGGNAPDVRGGGGAGGYAGTGGGGGPPYGYPGSAGTGGAGGGGGSGNGGNNQNGGPGGGVGILGQSSNGTGGSGGSGAGGAGSGGSGRAYGGGGGGPGSGYGTGGSGAVRIIWGTGRAFPSTNTGDM